MSEKDKGNLLAIADACEKIRDFVKIIDNATIFYQDVKTFDAVLMNFIIIGESVGRLSEELITQYPDIAWQKIKSFRNLIAHNYFGVNAEEVWQIIQTDIQPLMDNISEILKNFTA